MIVYRLQKIKYNHSILSGEGSKKFSGRWNCKDVPLIYCSESTSLAILEMRAHTIIAPPDYSLNIGCIEVPDECIHKFVCNVLPVGWDEDSNWQISQQFINPWLEEKCSLAFSVPSVINRLESNILINPLHPEIKRIKVLRFEPFNFNQRLY